MVKWVLDSIDQQWDGLSRKSSQSPVSWLELQSGNSSPGTRCPVLHGIARREGVLGQQYSVWVSQADLSLARSQLARSLTTQCPLLPLLYLQRPALSSARITPILPCPVSPFLEDAFCLLTLSLLSQRWHILFLFNDTDFSEGAHLFFQLDVSSPGVPCSVPGRHHWLPYLA